jgi:hypothetical protein
MKIANLSQLSYQEATNCMGRESHHDQPESIEFVAGITIGRAGYLRKEAARGGE